MGVYSFAFVKNTLCLGVAIVCGLACLLELVQVLSCVWLC